MELKQNIKPTFEEMAMNLLDGDKLSNILDFYSFLQNNKLTPKLMATCNYGSWKAVSNGKIIGYIRAYKDFWFISFFNQFRLYEEFEKYPIDDELKEFIFKNVSTKPLCGENPSCKGKGFVKDTVILGRMFKIVCGCFPFCVHNPSDKSLEHAKELVLINKKIAADIALKKKA